MGSDWVAFGTGWLGMGWFRFPWVGLNCMNGFGFGTLEGGADSVGISRL